MKKIDALEIAVEEGLKKFFTDLADDKKLKLPAKDSDFIDDHEIAEAQEILIKVVKRWAGLNN